MSSRTNLGPGGAGLRFAIVGSSTLKGKELTEIIPDGPLAAAEVRLLDDEETTGQLESVGEEMTFVQRVAADNFEGSDVVFFASDANFTKQNWHLATRAGSAVVDLSYGLENEKGASVRAPWIDRELGELAPMDLQPGPVVVAHPAAVVLAVLILRLKKLGTPKSAVSTIFEPASERGRKGLDELHQQTVNILSFQSLPKDVYDAQIAFNLLSAYGANAQPTLANTEKRIVDHFKAVVRGEVPVPALMLLQASVFHGHAFALYVEFAEEVSLGDVAKTLAGEHLEIVHPPEEEAPNNVGAAGQEAILVQLRPDLEHKNGVWIWAAADNLRVMGLNAVGSAEQLVASRPRGQVQ
ncbi:MAG TPA: Asd/ArgC dimerization domain-containing protein [Terriglobales bacterium]|nr:Asd/ArgC dimerization domain-containing protein [Terriglobales bacterium]